MMQAEETSLLENPKGSEVSFGRRRIAVGVVGAIALVALVAFAGYQSSGSGSSHPAQSKLSSDSLVQLSEDVASMYSQKVMAAQAAQTAQAPPIDKTLQALSPRENLHDNNPCADDEELFETLCYAKCSILSAGMKPVRCAAHICEPLDSNGQHKCQLSQTAIASILSSPSLMPCHGYDIAGTREGRKRCPHAPGACLNDEELYLGTCFKKCSVLTNGQYPHRKAFATCCKAPSLFQCLMPGQAKTDQSYAEGGGFGDHDPDTPAKAHAPLQSLTESR